MQHFRSLFETGWIPFHDLTILIGENDGGKTATLDILEILLGNKSPDDEDYSYEPGTVADVNGVVPRETIIGIEGKFSLTDTEQVTISEMAPLSGGLVHLRKTFEKGVGSHTVIVGDVPVDPRLRIDIHSTIISDLRKLATDLGLDIGGVAKQPFIDALDTYRAGQPTTQGEAELPVALRHLLPEFTRFDSASNPQSVLHGVLRSIFRQELEKPENSGPLEEVERNITVRLKQEAAALNPFVQKYRPEVKSVSVDPQFNFDSGFKASDLRLQDQNDHDISRVVYFTLGTRCDTLPLLLAEGSHARFRWSSESCRNSGSRAVATLITWGSALSLPGVGKCRLVRKPVRVPAHSVPSPRRKQCIGITYPLASNSIGLLDLRLHVVSQRVPHRAVSPARPPPQKQDRAMATSSEDQGQEFSPQPPQASRIVALPTVRRMRELLVYERELEEVGRLNILTSAFFSAASGCFLFAVGLVVNWLMEGKIDAKGTALLQFGGIAGTLFAIGFTGAGYWAWKTRGTLLDEMKKGAIDVSQSAQPPMPAAPQDPTPSGLDKEVRPRESA